MTYSGSHRALLDASMEIGLVPEKMKPDTALALDDSVPPMVRGVQIKLEPEDDRGILCKSQLSQSPSTYSLRGLEHPDIFQQKSLHIVQPLPSVMSVKHGNCPSTAHLFAQIPSSSLYSLISQVHKWSRNKANPVIYTVSATHESPSLHLCCAKSPLC